ncbi:MAG: RagB/SusD family nutrient uptake outer membrane protein [Bacteroidales bacterium]|nr:RagB/SusD family nutrient uptake outer membrane protein [Bacteroidales bacterium]
MKRFKTYILSVVLFAVTSCTSFLNVDSIGKATIESFFEDMTGLEAAGVGLHRELAEFYDSQFLHYPELAGDMVNVVALNADDNLLNMHNFATRSEDNAACTRLIWVNGYSVITNANNILYYGEKLYAKYDHPQEKAQIDKNFGYAYFARALVTFDLCLVYGQPYDFTPEASHLGVPAVTTVHGFDDIIARNSVGECYSQVISDLEKARELLGPGSSDIYYASGLAAEALLARVYLHKGDYANAEKYSKSVMDQVPLSPRSEYLDMYRQAYKTPGAESILRMNMYDVTSSMRSKCDPTANQKILPNDALVEMFSEDDIRLQLMTYVGESCEESQYAGKSFRACTKYCPLKSIVDERERRSDPFVLRCSEMYLIHAEALASGEKHDLKGAIDDVKTLQARARGISVEDITISYTDQKTVENIISAERIRELNFEGHRLFDITRRGENLVRPSCTTSNIKTINYPDYRFVLPICQMEMESNENMVQNPGYTGYVPESE